jgi:hypothetical protein
LLNPSRGDSGLRLVALGTALIAPILSREEVFFFDRESLMLILSLSFHRRLFVFYMRGIVRIFGILKPAFVFSVVGSGHYYAGA